MAKPARRPRTGRRDPTRFVLAEDFLARLERLVAGVNAARGREESGARARSAGGGDEFVGHRSYRPGEDLRDFDWELLARLERPFVRIRRREAGQRWSVLLDTSASMGLGEPGKLQLAAEVATAIAFSGVAAGAITTLLAFNGDPASSAVESLRLRKRGDLAAWIAFLEARRAAGSRSTRGLAADPRAAADRTFAVGDLLDLEPVDLLALARRGRAVTAIRVLAPHELAPSPDDGVEWLDPESGERVDLRAGAAAVAAYSLALERRLDAWRETFARHGQRTSVWSSDSPFEDPAREALRGT